MREQFEAWAKGKHMPLSLKSTGEYFVDSTEDRWIGWQASRAAIEIQLPDTEYFGDSWSGDYAIKSEDITEVLEAAGLKVK